MKTKNIILVLLLLMSSAIALWSQIVWSENFDSVTPPAVPAGWTIIDANNDTYTWETYNQGSSAHSSPNSMRIRWNSSMAMNDYAISPGLSLVGGKTYWIDFYYMSGTSFAENLKLMAGTAPTVAGMSMTLLDLNNILTHNSYQPARAIFTPPDDGTYYLGWHGYSDADKFYLYFDSVTVMEAPTGAVFSLSPDENQCDFGPVPVGGSAEKVFSVSNSGVGTLNVTSITQTDGTNPPFSIEVDGLSWAITPSDPPQTFKVVFAPQSDQGPFSTDVTIEYNSGAKQSQTRTITFTGNGYYPATLPFTENWESGQGDWVFVNDSQTNAWHIGTADPHQGSYSAYISNDDGTSNAYTINSTSVSHIYRDISFPTLSLEFPLSFMWKCEGEGAYTQYDYLRVHLVDTSVTPVAGTLLATGTLVTYNLQSDWTAANITLPGSHSGTTKRLVFSWRNDGGGGEQPPINIDDISLTAVPVTDPPEPAVLVSPADGAIDVPINQRLEWESGGGYVEGYRLSYGEVIGHTTIETRDMGMLTYYEPTLERDKEYWWTVTPYNFIGDASPVDEWTFTTLPEGMAIIGDGESTTLNLPLNPYYGYNYSQNIYLQSDINIQNQRIEKISYYWNGLNSGNNSKDWVVYMGHTDAETFASTTDWIPLSGLTQVYVGTLDIPATAGWVTINLTNPFVYNNSQNLVIAVDENTPGNDGSTTKFLGTATTGLNRGLRYQNDSTNPDPASPPVGILVAGYANIIMEFGDLPTAPIFSYTPTSIDFGLVAQTVPSEWQNVTVTNTGSGSLVLLPDDVTKSGPHADMFDVDTSNLIPLDPGESFPIPVRVTAEAEGDLDAVLHMNYNDTDYQVQLSAEGLPEGTVIIGDGEVTGIYLPVNTLWGYSYSQTIYHQDEIGIANQRIEKISYYWNAAGAGTNNDSWTIFMGHTDNDTFENTTAWIPFGQLSEVYSGTVNFPTSAGWMEITLDTPFVYNNSQNLVISVLEDSPSYTYGGSFLNTVSSGRSLRCQSDSIVPDPASPPSGTIQGHFPNIMMEFGDLPTAPIFSYTPTNIDFGLLPQNIYSEWRDVTVRNTGSGSLVLNPGDISKFGIDEDMFEFDDGNLPALLGSGEPVTIPVRVKATAEGPLSATLRMVYGSENYDVELSAEGLPAGTVFIGDGMSAQRQPYGTLWGYERSAGLYTQGQIGLLGLVDSAAWYCHATTETIVPYKIYAGTTSENALTAQTWDNFKASLTQVGEGTHVFDTTGWHTFDFDSPVMYSGGNLIVAVETYYGGTGGGSGHTFRYTTGTTGSHMYWYGDNNPPATNGTPNNLLPNLMLHLGDPPSGPPAAPILIYPEDRAKNLSKDGFKLIWQPDLYNGGIPDYYSVFMTKDIDDIFAEDPICEVFDGLTYCNPVDDAGIEFKYDDVWYWTVVANVFDGPNVIESDPAEIQSFEIQSDPRKDLPYAQDFGITGDWPLDWTQTFAGGVTSNRWSTSNTANAGGTPYEMACGWVSGTGVSRLITPPLNTENIEAITVKFKHMLNSYGADCTGKLQYSHDLATWNDTGFEFPTNVDFTEERLVMIPNLNAPSTYLAWVMDGNHYQFNYWYVDDIYINELLDHDVAVTAITNPVGEVVDTDAGAFDLVVEVTNFGLNPESFDVEMYYGIAYPAQSVSNLSTGQSTTVTFQNVDPIDGLNLISITTQLTGDENPDNDEFLALLYGAPLDVVAYSDVLFSINQSATPLVLSVLKLSDPQEITPLEAPNLMTNNLFAADWIDGAWWGAETQNDWWQIDIGTGAMTSHGTHGLQLGGVAWDPFNDIVYATNGTNLYELNKLTGQATLMGSLTWSLFGEPLPEQGLLVSLAFDNNTQTLYGLDIGYDAVFEIDPQTLDCAALGLNIGWDIHYAQDMAFDQDTGLLYVAACTESDGMLLLVNTHYQHIIDGELYMGEGYLVDSFINEAELDGFVIPYGIGEFDPPTNLAIDEDGNLSWDDVGAHFYKIYRSPDPYTEYTLAGSTAYTNWQDPDFEINRHMFYHVTSADYIRAGQQIETTIFNNTHSLKIGNIIDPKAINDRQARDTRFKEIPSGKRVK